MKKNFSLILASAVTVLLAICVVQSFQMADQKKQIAILDAGARTNGTQIKALQGMVKRLEAQRSSYGKEIRSLTEQNSDLASERKSLATAKDSTDSRKSTVAPKNSREGLETALAEMLKDPEMKKAMQAQQKQIVKMMYGPILKDLRLTSEETDRFNELLLGQQMKNMDAASSLMSQDVDRSEIPKQMKTGQEELDAKLKDLLGEDRYAQYTEYTQTLPDRMVLDQFNQQSSDTALNEQQKKMMLEIMREERKNSGIADISKPENIGQMTTPGLMDKFVEQQKTINERVYARATDLLTPEQLQSFGTFQSNQFEMQQVGFKMAQKMWGGKTNSTVP